MSVSRFSITKNHRNAAAQWKEWKFESIFARRAVIYHKNTKPFCAKIYLWKCIVRCYFPFFLYGAATKGQRTGLYYCVFIINHSKKKNETFVKIPALCVFVRTTRTTFTRDVFQYIFQIFFIATYKTWIIAAICESFSRNLAGYLTLYILLCNDRMVPFAAPNFSPFFPDPKTSNSKQASKVSKRERFNEVELNFKLSHPKENYLVAETLINIFKTLYRLAHLSPETSFLPSRLMKTASQLWPAILSRRGIFRISIPLAIFPTHSFLVYINQSPVFLILSLLSNNCRPSTTSSLIFGSLVNPDCTSHGQCDRWREHGLTFPIAAMSYNGREYSYESQPDFELINSTRFCILDFCAFPVYSGT